MSDRMLALVADDDPDILELVRLRLSGQGYEVVGAGDGLTALALARERVPELAILDIGMPGIDGVELTRRLREDPRTEEIAVILLTARVAEGDVGRGFDAGAVEYITKPFSPRQLVEAVKRHRTQIELRRREAEVATLADEQAALRRVATAVAAGGSPEDVFRLVAEESARLFGADCCQVLRFEDREGVVVGGHGEGVPGPGSRFPLTGGFTVAQVRRSGRAARIDDYSGLRDEDPVNSGAIPRTAMSGAAAPVRVGAALWGAVAVVSTSRTHAFPDDVTRRLSGFSELVGMAIANADARARLARLASTDGLTQLPNQRTFHERLADEAERARRHGRPLSLVVFDLDRFKQVNDTLGHAAGDRVLAEAARRLAALARAGDTLARVGGEEFAWVLPETDGEQAMAAAERARREIAATPFPEAGTITMSAGVCELADAGDPTELFRRADVALYCAKAGGRDACVRYRPDTMSLVPSPEATRSLGRARELAGIRSLVAAVDERDPSTRHHPERVAGMAERLALAAGWPAERAGLLAEAALFHDIGKIGLSDGALREEVDAPGAPGGARHEEAGARIAAGVLSSEQVGWIRHQHERHDGAGRPGGLAGDAVPDGARLLALADAWDAMTEARHDGPPMTVEDARAVCRSERGGRFAPEAVDALEAVLVGLRPERVPATER